MNSQKIKNKQHACVLFFRRKGYTIIFLVFGLLVLSQLKHLLNISNLIGSIPIGNVYLDITNNTTIDVQSPASTMQSGEVIYIVTGELGLNLRTQSNKTSPLITTLPPGSIVISAPHKHQSLATPDRIAITYPVRGWVSAVTPHSRLIPVRTYLPSCRPDTFLPGVKYTILKSAVPGPMSRRNANGQMPPPPPFGSDLPPTDSKLPNFVTVKSNVECCHACATSPSCAGWTFMGGMCLMRAAGVPFKTATGLSESIVSGSMEFSLGDAFSTIYNQGRVSDNDRKEAKSSPVHRFHPYILSMDPMHYLRKGAPFSSTMPSLPSSWMEQWPVGNGRLGALVGGYAHEEVVPVSIAGLHVIAGNTGADAVVAATRDNILTKEGEMAPNFHPHSTFAHLATAASRYKEPDDLARKTRGLTSRKSKPNRQATSLELFQESRQALMDGDTGMSQILLTKTVDDKSYGQTQYALDMIFIFFTEPVSVKSSSGFRGKALPEEGRLGRLSHLKSLLDLRQPKAPLNILHSRNYFNSITGVSTSVFLSRVQSELLVHSREWFTSLADDVLVGRLQCKAVSIIDELHQNFPEDASMFMNKQNIHIKNKGVGCLNMAFKVDREMNQKGTLLAEKFIRIVHMSNRRNYEINTEPKGGQGQKNSNTMAYSLSHSPTCGEYMHRFVESCGVVTCSGATEHSPVLDWGDNDAGLKAIVCNGAEEAVVISTTVIGNYPKDPKTCPGPGLPYQDKAYLTTLRSQCWDIIDKAMLAENSGNEDGRSNDSSLASSLVATLKSRHIAVQQPMMTASDVVFGGSEDMTSYTWAEGVQQDSVSKAPSVEVATRKPEPPPLPPLPPAQVDYRCTLKEDNAAHAPQLLSFQQECVQSASSTKVTQNTYRVWDNVAEAPDALPSPLEEVSYSPQQKYALRSLLTSIYARSKYMLHASGSRQAFGLMEHSQMSYWAVPALPRISSAVNPPLRDYIQQLASAGEATARRLYNCSGWVAHGYVDNLMNTAIRGGLMWNMCVTCGAWLALHLWDQLSHSFDSSLLVHVLLPVYRNLALFFVEYMFEGPDGHMHTGPTASPENSYWLKLPNSKAKASSYSPRHVRVITHSPNIDVSVLRQISNIYSLTLSWVETESDQPGNAALKAFLLTPDFVLDKELSRRLKTIIMKMPNGAIPVASALKSKNTKAETPPIANEVRSDAPNGFMSSLLKRVLPPKGRIVNTEEKASPSSVFIIDEYVRTPLASNRSNMAGYPYSSRPNSDRYINPSDPRHDSRPRHVEVVNNEPAPLYTVSEKLDRSHRHFSALLWLYPGTFLPSARPPSLSPAKKGKASRTSVSSKDRDKDEDKDGGEDLYAAAGKLLQVKVDAGGGHTSWSAVWQACLLARLRDTKGLERAMQKLLSRYFTPSLLSVHPAIVAVPPSAQNDNFGCESCYKDFNNVITDGWKASSLFPRGMMTSSKGQFQFDGNAGVLAAVHEMLLQSHLPQVIAVLPAVTTALREQGLVRRLRARGGVVMSFMWTNGEVSSAVIDIPNWHPAFRPLRETDRGFFELDRMALENQSHTLSQSTTLTFIFPNYMEVKKLVLQGQEQDATSPGSVTTPTFSPLPTSQQVHSAFPRRPGDALHALHRPTPPSNAQSHDVAVVRSYPLKLYLCKKTNVKTKKMHKDNTCNGELKILEDEFMDSSSADSLGED